MRLDALRHIMQLLANRKALKTANKDKETCGGDNVVALNSAYLQLLAGCFGMGPMPADMVINAHIYHYLVSPESSCSLYSNIGCLTEQHKRLLLWFTV